MRLDRSARKLQLFEWAGNTCHVTCARVYAPYLVRLASKRLHMSNLEHCSSLHALCSPYGTQDVAYDFLPTGQARLDR